MEEDWTVSRITRENKDKAWRQLGTSGSGNHFVEFGAFTVTADEADPGRARLRPHLMTDESAWMSSIA